MNKKPDSRLLSELADVFIKTARALNDYRFDGKKNHTIHDADFEKLGREAKALLRLAEQMKVTSTLMVPEEIQESLVKVKQLGADIEKTVKGLKNIQKIIHISTGLAHLGNAIIQKNVTGIQDQVKTFLDMWKDEA